MPDRTASSAQPSATRVPAWHRVAPALIVLLVATLASLHSWLDPVRWNDPDSLYYQAKVLSFRGEDEHDALHRAFRGPLAEQIVADERAAIRAYPDRPRQFTNPVWIDYSSRFFHRRVLVPLLGAAIYPIFELRSLLTISLVGYLLLSIALFAFLRQRFSAAVSVVVAGVGILAPPIRDSSFVPMVDSWGLLLETCALLAAVLFFDRGPRWIAAWIAVLVALSITRDNWVVPLVAVGCLFLHQRERRSALLLGTGIAAVLPAVFAFGNSSIRENLAFAFSGFNPPMDSSWSFVAQYYPHNIRVLVQSDLEYGTGLGAGAPIWFLALALVAFGVVLLVRRLRSADAYFRLAAYSLLGAIAYVALFARYSDLRQEIAFLPAAAVALALVCELGWQRYRQRQADSPPRHAVRADART
jgi:hypothetical protein